MVGAEHPEGVLQAAVLQQLLGVVVVADELGELLTHQQRRFAEALQLQQHMPAAQVSQVARPPAQPRLPAAG